MVYSLARFISRLEVIIGIPALDILVNPIPGIPDFIRYVHSVNMDSAESLDETLKHSSPCRRHSCTGIDQGTNPSDTRSMKRANSLPVPEKPDASGMVVKSADWDEPWDLCSIQ